MPVSIPPLLKRFLRDRTNTPPPLFSVNLAVRAAGMAISFPVQLSTNGHFALFESTASDLVIGDTNSANDVFPS